MLRGNENKKWLVNILVVIVCLTVVGTAQAVTLAPGDLIVADFNGAFGGIDGESPSGSGRIIKVDPSTGAQTIISSGNLLDAPYSVAIDAVGNIIVLDKANSLGGGTGVVGQIIKVNPADGSQTVISEDGLFVNPQGIAIDAAGNIIVADFYYGGTGGIIKVHPTTGVQTVISSGGSINYPNAVTIDGAGNIYVTSSVSGSSYLSVVKVNPSTGAQTVISSGTFDVWNGGIVIDDTTGNIFVSEIYWINGIIKVDPATGAQTILSDGFPFGDPYQLDIDPSGNIIVADSGWWAPGSIIKINPAIGATTVISSGGLLIDPAGIAVVPEAPDPVIEALIDISPDTLNRKSHGKWITVYITLPEEFDVETIDILSIAITSLAGATCDPEYIQEADLSFVPQVGDRDEDGIADLTVKFDRQVLLTNLCSDDVGITIEGVLLTTGELFSGSDSIRIIDRGK